MPSRRTHRVIGRLRLLPSVSHARLCLLGGGATNLTDKDREGSVNVFFTVQSFLSFPLHMRREATSLHLISYLKFNA